MPEILRQILQEVKSAVTQGLKPKMIFDLDSTVFDVSQRITRIFHEFAAVPRNQLNFPRQTKILATVTPHPQDYGVKKTLERYQFPMEDRVFFQVLVDYWKQGFFSGNYLKYDQPYPGVIPFIKALETAGAEILYLTGRDIPRMKSGTVASLQQHGLPIAKDASNLFLKPNSEISDVEFKKQFFASLRHTPAWFFENEPANIIICIATAPNVQVVFVDTVHSGTGPLPPDTVLSLKSWVQA